MTKVTTSWLTQVTHFNGSFRVDFYVRQRWQAEGLEFPKGLFKDDDKPDLFISAEENVLQSVWSPDSFIPNARDASKLLKKKL